MPGLGTLATALEGAGGNGRDAGPLGEEKVWSDVGIWAQSRGTRQAGDGHRLGSAGWCQWHPRAPSLPCSPFLEGLIPPTAQTQHWAFHGPLVLGCPLTQAVLRSPRACCACVVSPDTWKEVGGRPLTCPLVFLGLWPQNDYCLPASAGEAGRRFHPSFAYEETEAQKGEGTVCWMELRARKP